MKQILTMVSDSGDMLDGKMTLKQKQSYGQLAPFHVKGKLQYIGEIAISLKTGNTLESLQ